MWNAFLACSRPRSLNQNGRVRLVGALVLVEAAIGGLRQFGRFLVVSLHADSDG
jgi:hypothetical protein